MPGLRIAFALMVMAMPALTSPAAANPNAVALGDAPTLGGGTFSMGGGITVAVKPRRAPGDQLALCGVWAASERLSAYVRPHLRDVLAPATVAVDGQVVLHDLRIFPRVAAADSYASAPGLCIGTDQPYDPGASVEIRIPRKTVVRERDRDGPSFDITFQPRTGQNPALSKGSILPTSWTRLTSPGDKYPTDALND